MISLNLISPEQQKNLRLKYWQTLVKNCCGVLLIAGVAMAIWLIPLKDHVVRLELANQNTKTAILNNNQDITAKVIALNANIGELILIKNRLYFWSQTLNELAKLAPAETALLEFNGSAQNGVFTLKGYAKTREALIAFLASLNASANFKEIDSPLENYLQKNEVTFSISGKLNQ